MVDKDFVCVFRETQTKYFSIGMKRKEQLSKTDRSFSQMKIDEKYFSDNKENIVEKDLSQKGLA